MVPLELGPADADNDGRLEHRELTLVLRLAQQRAHDALRAAVLPAARAAVDPIFARGSAAAGIAFVYPDFALREARSSGDARDTRRDGDPLRKRLERHLWDFADVAPTDGRLSRAEFLVLMRPSLAQDAVAYERWQAERRLMMLDKNADGTLAWDEVEAVASFRDIDGTVAAHDIKAAFDRCGHGEGLVRGLQSDATLACFAALSCHESAVNQASARLLAADTNRDLFIDEDEDITAETRQQLQALLDQHRDVEAEAEGPEDRVQRSIPEPEEPHGEL